MLNWHRSLLSVAGVLGLAGIAVGAAGAHRGGSNLSLLASQFLLVHAAAIIAIAALNRARWRRRWAAASALLAAGVALFSCDLAMLDLEHVRLVPGMAPIGGTLMLLGWGGVIASALTERGGGTTAN